MTARGQFFFNPPEPVSQSATTLGLVLEASGDNSVVLGIGTQTRGGTSKNSIIAGAKNSSTWGSDQLVLIGSNLTVIGPQQNSIIITETARPFTYDTTLAGAAGSTCGGNILLITDPAGGYAANQTYTTGSGSQYGMNNVVIGSPSSNGGKSMLGLGNVQIGTSTSNTYGGTYSTCIGYSASVGYAYATAIGYACAAGASLNACVAVGIQCNANSSQAVALGYSATANTSSYALAVGYSSTSSGFAGIALGALANDAGKSNALSIMSGRPKVSGAVAFQPGIVAPFSTTASYSQWEIATLAASTADATLTELLGVSSDRLVLPNNTCLFFNAYVVAHRSDVQGDNMAWRIEGAISRGATAATTALIGTPTFSTFNSSTLGWTIAVTADTTNGALVFKGTGEAAKTIKWLVRVNTVEMTA